MTGPASRISNLIAGLPVGDRLLQTCRLGAFGTEAYSHEPIAALIHRAAPPTPVQPHVVACCDHVALFDGARAAFADMAADRVARLWILGPEQAAVAPIVTVTVPHDTDLRQGGRGTRDRIFFDAADHPLFADDHQAHLSALVAEAERALGRSVVPFRTRCFVVRAFSVAGGGAALLALDGLTDGAVRHPFRCHAALHFRTTGETLSHQVVVIDAAALSLSQETPWRPYV